MRHFIATVAALILVVGVNPIAHADPPEVMLRDATGYPDSSHTDGRMPIYALSYGGSEQSWSVSALSLHLDEATILTRLAGVGFEKFGVPFNWGSMVWKLNVWQAAGEFTAREMYEQSPKHGNVLSNCSLLETHEPYSADDFYVSLTPLEQTALLPGEYLLSIRAYTTDPLAGHWSFRETDIDLGTDFYAAHNLPGQSLEYTADLGYPTGSEALDIWGYEITCPGDLDFDDDIDLDDFALFAGCMAGPDVTNPPPGCDPVTFGLADVEGDDGDVDLLDFATFQQAFGKHCEALLRDASCYPDPGCAGGGAVMGAWHNVVGGLYTSSAFELTVSRTTVVTGFNGIGTSGLEISNWAEYQFKVNIHSDFQAWADHPHDGNIESDALLIFTPPADTFGNPSEHDYYVELELPNPVMLDAGVYVFSVSADATGSNWYWRESAVDLGSEKLRLHYMAPGLFLDYVVDLGYSTGTSALDVVGYTQ